MRLILLTTILLSVSSCIQIEDIDPDSTLVEGLRPVYAIGEWQEISISTPKPIEQLGKIYYKDQTIYAVEQYKGIHIIDNSDPTGPEQIHFLEIVGVRDLAIKGNIMYVDNVTDLVSIDVSDLSSPKVLSRVKDLYSDLDQSFPQGYEGPFECADPGAGIVIGWEPATIDDPKCWR